MTRIKNSLGYQALALFLSFIMLFGLIPISGISANATESQYGTLSGITADGTLMNSTGANATITYSNGATLDWAAQNPDIGRSVDGWWIGVKMTAPEDMKTEESFEGVTLKSKGSSGVWSEPKQFWGAKDSDNAASVHFIELWGAIDEEKLNDALASGSTIQYQWEFDWNADDAYEQTATLIIDPHNIVLKKSDATVYPKVAGLGTVSYYNDGITVSNENGSYVNAAFTSSVTLSWVAANIEAGRTQDGWWAGLKITAPDALKTEDDFSDVTFKSKGSSNEWSDPKNFWDYKDSTDPEGLQFLGLWGLLTDAYLKSAATADSNIVYSWKFDWNKDGIYEQQVNLSIDPSKITLKDSGGNQVYPTLGTVEPYTGGTVSGVTGNINVTVDQTTLNWSPKQPDIGRAEDAWWVGIKVTAPDYDKSVLQDAKYQRKSASDWSGALSFWDKKDSDEGADSQFIGLWMPLTPAKLREAKAAENNIVFEYQFDWNNDGNYEQRITVTIVPSDRIVLNKIDQTGFAFENESPVDQWAGQEFINKASGGQSSGKIEYSIISGNDIATINKDTGTVKFSQAGKITVRATKYGDDTYNDATAEYTVTAIRYPQTEFKFATSNPSAIPYAEGKIFENPATGGSGSGEVTYRIISGEECAKIDAKTGTVTLLKAGQITVEAKKAADAFYNETTVTYTLTINRGTQDALVFSTLPKNKELVYQTSPYENVISVSGGNGTGAQVFSIVDGEENATITPDGKITTLQAGTFTVRVEKEGDDCYAAATPIEETLTVVRADQTTFAFTYPTPNPVTYNENNNTFENPAIGGESAGKVTYDILTPGGDSIVDIADDGKLTIKRAGEVTISATKAEDNKYKSKTIQYTLTIQKTDQTFTFKDGDNVSKYYGIKSYINEVVYTKNPDAADGTGYGTGAVTYEVSGDLIGASAGVDGTITFTDSDLKVGTITVKAKKEADECYNEVEKTYTLTVAYLPTPDKPFTLSGETKNDSGWYTGDVTITPAAGYSVSYNGVLSTNDWAESVVYSTEGTNSPKIFLRDADGSITDAIVVENLKIDKTDPTDVSISYSNSLLDKVLETFGIYNAPVTVKLTAKNVYSGIDSFTYNYNDADVTVQKSDISFENGGVATYEFKINPEYRGVVQMTATSAAGRSVAVTGDKTLVVDSAKPERSVSYEFASENHREDDGKIYTQGSTTVHFEIDETNFDLADEPVVKVNEIAAALDWTQDGVTQKWKADVTISTSGAHKIALTYTDVAGNEMESYEKTIIIDATAPVVTSLTYDNNTAKNGNYYSAPRKATIKIFEEYFKPEEFIFGVEATDVAGNAILKDGVALSETYLAYLKNPSNWKSTGNIHTAEVTFDDDAKYKITLDYTDIAGNKMEQQSDEFIVDQTVSTSLQISYSQSIIEKMIETLTFGFYNPSVEVTLKAEDITAGVDYFVWTYTQEAGTSTTKNVSARTVTIPNKDVKYSEDGKTATATFTLEGTDAEQFRGSISFDVYDRSGNKESTSDSNRINVVDTISPTRSVKYSEARVMDETTLMDIKSYTEADHDHVKLYYEKEAVVTFIVDEANFYAEDVKIKVNGEDRAPTDWKQNGDVWTGTITISGDGDYVVTMEYTDRSNNVMESYTSPKIAIDNTAPTISVSYDPTDAVANEKYFNTNRSMTVTVTEHNFRADDLKVKVTAKDASGVAIANEAEVVKEISDYLTDRAHWKSMDDTHVATVSFMEDAQYDVTIDYKDMIGNAAVQYAAPPFVVDHLQPSEPVIEYSDNINFWDVIANNVTFGYYTCNPSVTVTVTSSDETSGIDYFEWIYTKQDGISSAHVDKDSGRLDVKIAEEQPNKKVATASFTLTADEAKQYRGHISVTAFDRSTNRNDTSDSNRINIVDTISPKINVTYSSDGANVRYIDEALNDVNDFASATKAFFNKNVKATISIDDANFFEGVTAKDGVIQGDTVEDYVIHEVGILLTKTDKAGNVTRTEYLPEGATQKYADAIANPVTWTHNGDKHTFEIEYADDADYVLTVEYTDLSENEAKITASDSKTATAKTYVSKTVTVDKIAPVIDVDYKNSDVKNTVRDNEGHDRQYFDKGQTATITITEHNFRPDDVVIKIKAKDVVGSNVFSSCDADGYVNQYASEGRSREEWAELTPYTDTATWRRDGDTFKLVLDYTSDANYTFDIEYRDLAGNDAADYSSDYFTVDKTAPKNLAVAYSTNVFENVLESVTFGYYNAQMTVTLTAEDDTSGIYHFLYSYVKSEGVSDVNAELIDDAINSAAISYDGAKATAEFKIPKYVLANDNQFNGTVRFTAFDRAENKMDMSDTERIIVDNIKPTINVTYNDPVRKVNNISYYANTANVSVDINEANFFEQDVRITVTKNGRNYAIKDLVWNNASVDKHTGTFTLPDDGDYIVSVTYTDRSGNVMDSYQSNRITVDKTKPTVSVSNIKNNSANKDDVYTFTITANDTNIDFETFKPELKALVRNESGNYSVKSIPLGDVKTVEAGKTYSFTVQNLDEDAAYTLTSVVRDMSGNEYVNIKLDDGNEYGNIRFSINRNGSTFAANEFTSDLVEQYYVYSIDNDIVLEEINVDPIENYIVKLNGEALQEGKDYTTTITNQDGKWSKRTYVIHKSLFEAEGEYSIVVESTDKASSTAYSDVKNLKIAFVVDRTEPVLTVSGVEDGGRYQIDEQPVTVIPTDDGGRLYSFKAIVFDASGNPLKKDGEDVSVRFDMAGEELLKYLDEHEGKIVFTIPEGLENQVQLICNDCAVKADGTTNEYNYTYTKVTVSQSRWVIFYANKPLFYSSIAGVVLLAGIVTGLIIFLKKREKAGKATK